LEQGAGAEQARRVAPGKNKNDDEALKERNT
jgi:hypothetical protein